MRLALITIIALLMASAAAAQSSSAPVASLPSESRRLLDEGAKLYHQGQIDESLDAYERAIVLLGRQQRLEEAFAAGMTMAAIEREAGRQTAAAERYRQLALSFPDYPRAAEAHRLAILAVVDALRSAPPVERQLLANGYEMGLEEHLANWPRSATADNARVWLGQLLASRREWSAAREAVAEVGAASPDYSAAVVVIADSYQCELEQRSETSQPDVADERAALVATATKHLLPVITGANNRWPETWNHTQRYVAVAIARLHLEFSAGPSSYAERLLVAALDGLPDSDSDDSAKERDFAWAPGARSLLLVALIRNDKLDDARSQVSELAAASTSSLVEAVEGIDLTIRSLDADERVKQREMATIALSLLRLLDARRESLDARATASVRRYRANMAVAAGDQTAAIAEYAKLAAAEPENEQLQTRYAELLARSNSTEDWRRGLAKWQEIEQLTRRGGDVWRRARQSRIDLLNRLGKSDEAEKLLRLTNLLYPDWNNSAPQRQ